MNWLVKRLARYGYARLREGSTWRNIILFVGGSWATAHPDQAALIVPVAISLAGLIGSFFPDLLGATTLEAHLDATSPDASLPPIDLQGRPEPGDAGADPQPVRSAAGMRQPMPSDCRSGAIGSAGPVTQPNPGPVGFGDRG